MDRDAILEITVSDDRMSARGTFLPPVGGGRLFTPDYTDGFLENAGVIHGIRRDEIAETLFLCNTELRVQKDILVAEGTVPVAERPSYWKIEVPVGEVRKDPPEGDDDPSRRVDYKGETRLHVVHPGDVIATRIPAAEGVPGMDVLGNEIPFPTESVPKYEPGANIRVDGDRAVADAGGRVIVTSQVFVIEDRLGITRDFGYATGSIEFPGDVIVKGEIKEGFHIWAGKSVTADRTVDVSEIYCKGAFLSAGGIIGRGKALLRAGDSVRVKFVQNCFVESKRDIHILQYAYHGRLGCLGAVTMEKTGRLIGGVVTAVNGVSCYNAGNAAGSPTLLRVGINFIAERKIRLAKEKHQQLTLRLQRLTARLGDNPTDRQLDILRRLEEARNGYAATLGELTRELDINEEAEVVVTGEAFPGVTIQICRAEYTVREKQKAVRFRLDKESGRVIVISLKESADEARGETNP